MREYQYRKIDAFTSGNSSGNPAACIYLAKNQTLTDAEMQEIAKQHKGFVSNVVYCRPVSGTSYELIYYSPESEIDFCGHATVACMYNLVKETSYLEEQHDIEIGTRKKGILHAYNAVAGRDAVYITAPEASYMGTKLNYDALAKALDLRLDQFAQSHPLDIIDTGLKTLIIPMFNLQTELEFTPSEKNMKTFCPKNNVDAVLTYSLETEDSKSLAHTRVFFPKSGNFEDPATGSANSAFAYYMIKNGFWNGKNAFVEQGPLGTPYNSIELAFDGSRVLFGGRATTRIRGVYCF